MPTKCTTTDRRRSNGALSVEVAGRRPYKSQSIFLASRVVSGLTVRLPKVKPDSPKCQGCHRCLSLAESPPLPF